jgi:hypothetical protein
MRQGPSFVVLVLLLVGLWHVGEYLVTEGLTAGIGQIQQGYREIQSQHDRNLERIISAFEKERAREASVVGVLRVLAENRELLDETRTLLRDLDLPRDARPTSPNLTNQP